MALTNRWSVSDHEIYRSNIKLYFSLSGFLTDSVERGINISISFLPSVYCFGLRTNIKLLERNRFIRDLGNSLIH